MFCLFIKNMKPEMSTTDAQRGLASEHDFRVGFELEFDVGFKLEFEFEYSSSNSISISIFQF